MPIKPSNVIYHELIGLEAEVVASPDPAEVGLRGVVVWETANLLILDTSGGRRRIPKRGRVFRLILPSGSRVRVLGSLMVGRPEERVKRI
ncbi:MAG: ribonuclease P protein subunit [Thermoproteota archaeon]|nr:MAG: ribonuclease P protein subunit [Candidatus Korarchaeota archaeon]